MVSGGYLLNKVVLTMQYTRSLKIVSAAQFHAYIRGILKETGFTEIYFCVYIYLTMFYVKSFIHISGVFEGGQAS
jgi:hypothetical protein